MPERRLLDTTELFTALPADVLDDLRKQAANRTYDRNELLFTQGDTAGELFVIEHGRIAIATKAPDGRESVLAVLESGAMFGELPLFDGSPRSADARALTESRVIVLEYEPVREVLQARPELLWTVTRLLARWLRATDEALGSSWPAATTSSSSPSPKKSSPAWSAPPASASTKPSRCSRAWVGSK